MPGGRLFTTIYDGQWTDAGTVASLLRASELARDDDAAGRLARADRATPVLTPAHG